MMIGARWYVGDGMAAAPKSLANGGAKLARAVAATGFAAAALRDFCITAWVRPRRSVADEMAALQFSERGITILSDGRVRLRQVDGLTTATTSAGYGVDFGEWQLLMMGVGDYLRFFNVSKNRLSQWYRHSSSGKNRLRLFERDGTDATCAPLDGDITRVVVWSASRYYDSFTDELARGAADAPDGALHWWDFADADTGVAIDRIGGLALDVSDARITAETPWT